MRSPALGISLRLLPKSPSYPPHPAEGRDPPPTQLITAGVERTTPARETTRGLDQTRRTPLPNPPWAPDGAFTPDSPRKAAPAGASHRLTPLAYLQDTDSSTLVAGMLALNELNSPTDAIFPNLPPPSSFGCPDCLSGPNMGQGGA